MTDFARAVRFQKVHLAIVGLIAAVFIVGVFASDRFVTVLNIANVQDQLVALALVALAQTVVILSGGIDLSFAGLLGLLSVLFATFAGSDPEAFAAAYIGILALGTVIGEPSSPQDSPPAPMRIRGSRPAWRRSTNRLTPR